MACTKTTARRSAIHLGVGLGAPGFHEEDLEKVDDILMFALKFLI